jgi:hypothetical protein
MNASVITACLLLATAPPSAPLVSPQLLIGEWRSEQGGTYHFYGNGTYSWHAADMIEDGRWRLRDGRQIELIAGNQREIIVIERVVHETLYVQHLGQRETWLKQPGA